MLAVAFGLLLSACGANSSDAPSYSTEPIGNAETGGTYHSTVGHYRLRFPAGWVTVDARGVSDKAIEALIQKNPEAADDIRRWRRSVTQPGRYRPRTFRRSGNACGARTLLSRTSACCHPGTEVDT